LDSLLKYNNKGSIIKAVITVCKSFKNEIVVLYQNGCFGSVSLPPSI
jgi:hypothetical protein